jgi:hypothetical protein
MFSRKGAKAQRRKEKPQSLLSGSTLRLCARLREKLLKEI